MTEAQSKKIQKLREIYQIKPDSYQYFFVLLGVGYGLSVKEVEDFLFFDESENMIQKDVRRICQFFELPVPKNTKSPELELKENVRKIAAAAERETRYRRLFEDMGVTLEEVEQGDVCLEKQVPEGNKELPPSNKMVIREVAEEAGNAAVGHYPTVCQLILNDNRFQAAQLEQLNKAVQLHMPEKEILQFANPEKSSVQMQKYIDFWLLINGKKKTKKKNWFHRKEMRRHE